MLGEDIDVMPALHQPAHGAQFRRDGAATVDEREQVRQWPRGVHRTAYFVPRDGSLKPVSRPSI